MKRHQYSQVKIRQKTNTARTN